MNMMVLKASLLLFALVGLWAPASAASTDSGYGANASLSAHGGPATIPATLRPALYRELAQDSSSDYRLDKTGCAILSDQGLKGCFRPQGAIFSGAGGPELSLRLVAWGSGANLVPVASVTPKMTVDYISYRHHGITEWWRVLPMGFEQGFTVSRRPAGNGKLTLALAISGRAERHDDTLEWGRLRYGGLVVTDANGKRVPATLESQGKRIMIRVDAAHATYPLTVDPLVWLEQKVSSDDGANGDFFGFSVAIDGDTAIVGAYGVGNDALGDDDSGAAYVFVKSAGVWAQTQKLVASDGAPYDFFGYAVALQGATAVIGAYQPGFIGQPPGPGAAYVFTESNGTWTQTQKLTAGDGESGDYFGHSVAVDGATILIGANRHHAASGGTGLGVTYVFTKSGGTWAQTQELTASDGAPSDYFGYSLAIDGDTALIGAPVARVDYPRQGTAYVFVNSNGTWAQTQELTANDSAVNAQFGWSVALDGSTALVGARYARIGANFYQGAAYVFTDTGGAWTQAQKLVASDGTRSSQFGYDVALDGTTVAVGSFDSIHEYQGAVYLFNDSNGVWTQTQKLVASDGKASAYFGAAGTAIAFSGSTLLVGAYQAAVGASRNGQAYFYSQSDLGFVVSVPAKVDNGQHYVSQAIATNNTSIATPAVAMTLSVPTAASFVSAVSA